MENLENEIEAEKLVNEAIEDLENKDPISAINKFLEAHELCPPTPTQKRNLENIAEKSLRDLRIEDFIIQLGVAGYNPLTFLKEKKIKIEGKEYSGIDYLTWYKTEASKKAAQYSKNGLSEESDLWLKRYFIAVKLLAELQK